MSKLPTSFIHGSVVTVSDNHVILQVGPIQAISQKRLSSVRVKVLLKQQHLLYTHYFYSVALGQCYLVLHLTVSSCSCFILTPDLVTHTSLFIPPSVLTQITKHTVTRVSHSLLRGRDQKGQLIEIKLTSAFPSQTFITIRIAIPTL